ncbi:flavin reductase [Kytococcus sp. Marseille-QA3725]
MLQEIPEDVPVLAVHAHPDDETLATGVALATLAERGHPVHVLTCTLGDHGEVLSAALQHLEGTPALAPHRRAELSAACAALGVQHRVLGEEPGVPDPTAVELRDSGMAGSPEAEHPRALVNAPRDVLADQVRQEIRRVGARIVLTYDETGGYGHPDHVAVHRAVVAAVRGLPPEERPDLFAAVTPRSWEVEGRRWVAEHVEAREPSGEFRGRPTEGVVVPRPTGPVAGEEPREADRFASGVRADEDVTHEVHGTPTSLAAVAAARRAHATQLVDHGEWWAMTNLVAHRAAAAEGYSRMDPSSGRIVTGDSALRAPLAGPMASRDDFRSAMGHLATGVTVLTTRFGQGVHAMTANAVLSVSLHPVLLAISIDNAARFCEAVEASGVFTVNVLPASARRHGDWLSTPGRPLAGQLDRVPTTPGRWTGLPLLQEALATAECRVVQRTVLGDHTLFVGLVEGVTEAPPGDLGDGTGPTPLVFHRGSLRSGL